jgi:hypothetical protein
MLTNYEIILGSIINIFIIFMVIASFLLFLPIAIIYKIIFTSIIAHKYYKKYKWRTLVFPEIIFLRIVMNTPSLTLMPIFKNGF